MPIREGTYTVGMHRTRFHYPGRRIASPLDRSASRQRTRFFLLRLLVDIDQAADGIGTCFAQRLPAARFSFAEFTLHFITPAPIQDALLA